MDMDSMDVETVGAEEDEEMRPLPQFPMARILVVDDERPVREVCVRTLRGLGCEVESAANGEAALARLGCGGFDLVLTDISMPGKVDGVRLCSEVKSRSPSTDVVIMTTYSALGSAVAALKKAETAPGDEAVGRSSKAFDIILTDLNMPGSVNGNELTRRVRSSTSSDVIIMTGNPELETTIEALRDGAYDYLVKPFTEEILRYAIRRCLDKRNLSKELAREKTLRAELDRSYTELSTMERMRDTFGHFVTPEVARFVLANPNSVSEKGEQKVLTVLFADVRSFSPFAGKVPPQQAVSALNEIFSCIIKAIQSEGGILSKFMGDGMMALFGAPAPLNHHAIVATKAAVKAMQAIESLARFRQEQGLIPLRVGMGINTGEMVAGCLGTAERTEYTVIGDAVNIASRLQGIAKPGQILVGPETVRLLKGAFKLRDHGVVSLSGISQHVRVEEIVVAI
jgi:class 3 adenylate cyclase/CheY-like chemotaxis protein